jgi:hypothetical protein
MIRNMPYIVFRKGMCLYLPRYVVLYHGRANPELHFVSIHSFVVGLLVSESCGVGV